MPAAVLQQMTNGRGQWWVETGAGQARATHSLEEALALCAHLAIRGQRFTCIRRGGKVVMDAAQIHDALEHLDNGAPFTQRLRAP